jgi:hypothetical protein
MLEDALCEVTLMAKQAYAELVDRRANGGSDREFVEEMIHGFVAAASSAPRGAGSAHYAISLYQMGLMADEIHGLREAVSMRDDALEMLFELDTM